MSYICNKDYHDTNYIQPRNFLETESWKFTTADELMPSTSDEKPVKTLQPAISFEDLRKKKLVSDYTNDESLSENVISQRKSSLFKMETLRIRNSNSSAWTTPRATISPLRFVKHSPVTPTGEFMPASFIMKNSNSGGCLHSSESEKSSKYGDNNDPGHRNSFRPSLDSLPSLSSLPSISNSDVRDPRLFEKMRHRQNISREIFFTGRQFAQDMAVIVRIYMCGSANIGLSMRQIDTLFSNVTHVMDISLSIVAILQSQIPAQILQNGSGEIGSLDVAADKELFIGKAMCLALTGQFYEVYETYIHNNRDQMSLCYDLTKQFSKQTPGKSPKQSSKEVQKQLSHIDQKNLTAWLQRSNQRAEKFTTAWSLDSLLIKPIQRLGKYPLFLKTLLDDTDPEHEDYEYIQRATKRSIQYMDCINTRLEAN